MATTNTATHVDRPATAPAYYLGRPASVWLAAFRRTKRQATSEAQRSGEHGHDLRDHVKPVFGKVGA
jgi:hypothetical protein